MKPELNPELNPESKTESKSDRAGTFLVVLAGCCWGLMSFFVRGLSSESFDSLQIVCLRSWFATLFLAGYFLARDRSLFHIHLRDLWMFLGTGLLSLTFFTYCYFTSILVSGAAVSVVLLYTSPIFVMLLSAVFFHEKITARKLLALFMTFAGCLLVAGLIGSGSALSLYALSLGLGAGFGYSLYSIFAGFAVKKYSSLTITFYTMLISGICMPVLSNPVTLLRQFAQTSLTGWLYMVGIAIICTVIPYIAYTLGLSRMEAGKAAVLVTVEPLVGSLLGILVYKEPADIFKIGGIILIFAAVILLSRPSENS